MRQRHTWKHYRRLNQNRIKSWLGRWSFSRISSFKSFSVQAVTAKKSTWNPSSLPWYSILTWNANKYLFVTAWLALYKIILYWTFCTYFRESLRGNVESNTFIVVETKFLFFDMCVHNSMNISETLLGKQRNLSHLNEDEKREVVHFTFE